jgi:hypothetical protein
MRSLALTLCLKSWAASLSGGGPCVDCLRFCCWRRAPPRRFAAPDAKTIAEHLCCVIRPACAE